MPLTESLGELEERPAELKEAIFNRLFEIAEIAKYTPEERQDYEESLKNFRDWYSCLTTAENKGRAEGRAEGIEKGRAEERLKAFKEKLESARSLKKLGVLSNDQIAESLNLTIEEIENL